VSFFEYKFLVWAFAEFALDRLLAKQCVLVSKIREFFGVYPLRLKAFHESIIHCSDCGLSQVTPNSAF
jgi:hypothetical protein